jgi:hypothetical protein
MTVATWGVDHSARAAATDSWWAMRSPFETSARMVNASPVSLDSRTT